jgi:hypothetical protein
VPLLETAQERVSVQSFENVLPQATAPNIATMTTPPAVIHIAAQL